MTGRQETGLRAVKYYTIRPMIMASSPTIYRRASLYHIFP